MAANIKRVLSDTETEIFYNWNDLRGSKITAKNITLCNTSGSAVDVWLSFVVLSGLFINGAILSETSIPANETITIEVTERLLQTDDSIRAYASVADVVSLSIDFEGDIEQSDIPPAEIP